MSDELVTSGEGQGHEAFVEPPRDEIPRISRRHVAAMSVSDADEVWVLAGMHHVVLRTLGRRSGREHEVALPFWRDPAGHPVVVASFAGAPQHPSWYLNLADRDANPEVLVRVQHSSYWAEAEVLDGDDYATTGPRSPPTGRTTATIRRAPTAASRSFVSSNAGRRTPRPLTFPPRQV